MDRTAIFIDGEYLAGVLRSFGSPRIDFYRLSRVLSEGHNLLRTYYYTCPPYQSATPTTEELDRSQKYETFIHRISEFPHFECRFGRLAFRGYDRDTGKPIYVQKGVDLLLGLDMALLATKNRIQRAILVSGDSDFVPAVQVARQEGCVVMLVHGPANTYPKELWKLCDDRLEIDQEFVRSILY